MEVRRAAAALSVGESTVWRWLAADDDLPRTRARYELTEADRDDYLDWRGNIAALRRARLARGEPVPPLRTLQRAFARDLSPAQAAFAVDGVEGRRRHEVYLRWEPVRRNALWEADHKQLPVHVLMKRAIRPIMPWVTIFLDGFSRLIMGWALSAQPNTGTVLAALRQGMVIDPERGPFGGVPEVLRPDNGLEFVNNTLRRVCGIIGSELRPAPPWVPTGKGKVERVNRTAEQTLVCGLPFYTDGPRAADGRLFGPDTPPMTFELFVDLFAAWVTDYNTVRPHRALGGQTPLQRWNSDPSPIRVIPAEELRFLLMAGEGRIIQRDGVSFDSIFFISPEMNGWGGVEVEVRYMPHDLRTVEIFRDDKWWCTAYPQNALSEEQRDQVLARRRADSDELSRLRRRASRRARAKLAPVTAPGPVQDATVITADQVTADDDAARAASVGAGWFRSTPEDGSIGPTDLLNLNGDFDYWNSPIADLDTGTGQPAKGQD